MGTKMFSEEISNGFPVLIIHGWSLDGKAEQHDLEPIFTKMTSRLCRIYVDLPGMGRTPADNVQNLDDIYHRLVQFIDARLGQSRFALVGSSCGGYLARAIAQKYADQVDGLLLRVPLIEPRDSKRDIDTNMKPLVEDEKLMASLPAQDKTMLGEKVLIQTPAYIKASKEKLIDVYKTAENRGDSRLLQAIRADPERYQLSWSLDDENGARFLAPTLILCGRHDDTVGYRDSIRLLSFYPRSTYAVLDRGTHNLPIDETALFEALVHDWIKRVFEWQSRAERQS
ncbi:hypothetical protein NQ176_g7999 [Zarea fungicola]|uniref:Uncharacterized protein n=1 Tax=Zarea fungicola TaxID=93591 RepID=A0ACC1MUX8_9HYPO|nr:hypothetical protein NQ176_g7999 [Lecanicillium fungicola]